MDYSLELYTKEEIEQNILQRIKDNTIELIKHDNKYNGFMSKNVAIDCISAWLFTIGNYDTKLEKITAFGDQLCYFYYDSTKEEIITSKRYTKEEMTQVCEKVLNTLLKKNIVIASKSGNGIKYNI